ncbi:hypothetical protein [Salicola sp. Rm-C-2C1-2]|uniref:hypothetical protein n=1 Tax=Salicola sp. Rm-C-2C1-2 TaxID=3141321 RepID=UPI0032E46E0B
MAAKSSTEVVTGRVRSVKAISQNVALVSLEGYQAAIRLRLDCHWYLDKGDEVALAATRQRDGVWLSHAYRNFTKGIGGGLRQAFFASYSLLILVLAAMLWSFTVMGLSDGGGAVVITFPLALLFTYVGGNLAIDAFRTTQLAAYQIRHLNKHLRRFNAEPEA